MAHTHKSGSAPITSTPVPFLSIDHLFRTKSLDEVRSLLRESQSNLAAKKKELRSLVGGHYRQVIEASDLVLSLLVYLRI